MHSQEEAFLLALEADTIDFCHAYLNREVQGDQEDFNFSELLQTLPRKLWPRLCSGVQQQVTLAVAALTQLAAPSTLTADKRCSGPASGEANVHIAADLLRGLAGWVATILQDSPSSAPEGLQQAAIALHDGALLAVPHLPELQEATAKLCLLWWQLEAPNREAVIAQTLPYLLVKAITTGKLADVKRCHALRAALPLLDFDDEASIGDLKQLLLRAAFCPAFLRPAEGRRFLSSLFSLQPQMVRELGAIIRNQIPAGRKSMLDAYGDVLFRAWRDATGGCLLEVEDFLQGLMQAAIVANSPALNTALRRVLDGFHSQKAHGTVDAMLLRLYEPLIFRGLSAANSSVRSNSLLLLVDAFPLQDPEASTHEMDELLTRQFAAIGSALGDGAPSVRAAAASGICTILNTFWELLPSPVIAGFVKRLTSQLVYDASSPTVRSAALAGLALLVENPIAQPLLKVMLPSLGRVLWDPSMQVRAAFVDLLICIQRVAALSVTDLVSAEDLLEALSLETPGVTRKIQRLLLPSYFPNTEDGPSLVAFLLRSCPAAGQAFCNCLAGASGKGPMTPVEDLICLARELKDHLLASPPSERELIKSGAGKVLQRGKRKKRPTSEPEAEEAAEPAGEDQESAESWEAILQGLCKLCAALRPHLDALEHADGSAAQDIFEGNDLCALLDMAQSTEGRTAVLSIGASRPHETAASKLRHRCELRLNEKPTLEGAELMMALCCVTAVPGGKQAVADLLDSLSIRDDSECEHQQAAILAASAVDGMLRHVTMRGVLLTLDPAPLHSLKMAATHNTRSLTGLLQILAEGGRVSTAAPIVPAGTTLLAYARVMLHCHLLSKQVDGGHDEGAEAAAPEVSLAQLEMCIGSCTDMAAESVLGGLEGWDNAFLLDLVGEIEECTSRKRSKRSKALERDSTLPTAALLAREAWDLIMGVLMITADAAKLLSLNADSLAISKACALAFRLLTWLKRLPASIAEGSLFGPADGLSEALGLSARLACFALQRQQASEGDGRDLGPSLSQVPLTAARPGRDALRVAAEASEPTLQSDAGSAPKPAARLSRLVSLILELGSRIGGSHAAALKPFLGRLLAELSREDAALYDRGWLEATVQQFGKELLAFEAEKCLPDGVVVQPEQEHDENANGNVPRSHPWSSDAPKTAQQTSSPVENLLLTALVRAAVSEKVVNSCMEAAMRSALLFFGVKDHTACVGAVHLVGELRSKASSGVPKLHEDLRSLHSQAKQEGTSAGVNLLTDKLASMISMTS